MSGLLWVFTPSPVRYSTRGLGEPCASPYWVSTLRVCGVRHDTGSRAAIRSNVSNAVLRRGHVHAHM